MAAIRYSPEIGLVATSFSWIIELYFNILPFPVYNLFVKTPRNLIVETDTAIAIAAFCNRMETKKNIPTIPQYRGNDLRYIIINCHKTSIKEVSMPCTIAVKLIQRSGYTNRRMLHPKI